MASGSCFYWACLLGLPTSLIASCRNAAHRQADRVGKPEPIPASPGFKQATTTGHVVARSRISQLARRERMLPSVKAYRFIRAFVLWFAVLYAIFIALYVVVFPLILNR